MPHTTPQPQQRTQSDEDFARRVLADHERLQHANQLTAAEIEAVRQLIASEKFWTQAGSKLKALATFITALVAAGVVSFELLTKLIRSIAQGGS